MNNLMVFEGNNVEVIEWNGNVLFNPYHVGNCLELSSSRVRDYLSKMNNKQALKLKNSDVGNTDIRKLNNAGEKFLTISGVFKLVFKSQKEDAEKFQDWVTDEVLPSIAKTGSYVSKQSTDIALANELTEMREEYNFFFEEVKNSYEELSERVDKIMNIQLNTMINIEKLANSFCMIAQAQANTIETKPIEPKQPKREEDTFTISDIAAELGLPNPKKKAAMLNKILAEETVIVCEGKNKFPSPILPKDWYIKAKFIDKTTKEITHYVIWTAKGKEEIIKILKKHLPVQTKMKI